MPLVIESFPMSWLFVTIAGIRKVTVSFGSLHLLELKTRNLGGRPLRRLSWSVRAGLPDNSICSQHSFPFHPGPLYSKGKVPDQPRRNVGVKVSYPGGPNT